MKIWIHDSTGHPFQVELSRELARRGHEVVHTYLEDFESPKGQLSLKPQDPKTLEIRAITTGRRFPKNSYFQRWWEERVYGDLLSRELHTVRPDAVLASNLAIGSASGLVKTCRKIGVPYVHWLQDIYGRAAQTLLEQRLGLLGRFVGRWLSKKEHAIWQKSSAIVAISEAFLCDLQKAGVNQDVISVINNWAPIDELPVMSKSNDWSRHHGLHDQFVFLYSGTLGRKHNPEHLVALANRIDPCENVKLVVCSQGTGMDYLKRKKCELKLRNMILLPFQDYSDVPKVMASGNILLVLLEADAGQYSVPSKTLSYTCAGRPIVMSGPTENLAAQIICQHDLGSVVTASNTASFVESAHAYIGDTAKCEEQGKNARRYAEKSFDIASIGAAFEKVITDATA